MKARADGICARCGEPFKQNHHIQWIFRIGPVHDPGCCTEGERARNRGWSGGTWKKGR